METPLASALRAVGDAAVVEVGNVARRLSQYSRSADLHDGRKSIVSTWPSVGLVNRVSYNAEADVGQACNENGEHRSLGNGFLWILYEDKEKSFKQIESKRMVTYGEIAGDVGTGKDSRSGREEDGEDCEEAVLFPFTVTVIRHEVLRKELSWKMTQYVNNLWCAVQCKGLDIPL